MRREARLVLDEARAVDMGVGQAELCLPAALEPLRRPLRGADMIRIHRVGRVAAVDGEGEAGTDALRHELEDSNVPSMKYPGDDLFSQEVAPRVSSALESLTSVFGMGTGVTSPLASPG